MAGVKINPGRSFGVMRKNWGWFGLQALLLTSSNIILSFVGSMPWLISSTNRNGQSVISCKETKYNIVVTERSYKAKE